MSKMFFLEKPVFICGHRRSGTTLLLSLMENHPELLVYPPDSGFFYAYYPIYENPKYSNQERIEQIIGFCIKNLDDMLNNSFSKETREKINFSISDFIDEFKDLARKSRCTSKELLVSLITAYYKNYGYPERPKRWVDKTTSTEIYAAEALRWFPQAKFIHVLRDPRDNWASLKSGWEVRSKHFNDQVDRLMHSMIERGKFGFELAIKNPVRFGKDIYKVIRFEDLVKDTEGVMKEVCNFVEVSFDKNVLIPTACGKAWQGNNYNNMKFNGPSSQNVERWRERITEEEAQLIEYYFEDYMEKFGYPLYFKLDEKIDAAVNHYKWYNYAQSYSFTSTQKKAATEQNSK